MNIKTRVTVLNTIFVIEMIFGVILVILMTDTNGIPGIYCFPFLVLAVLWVILLYFLPARCDKPGCQGRMKTNWVKDSDGSERLRYVCSDCGEIFETGFSVGLGEPW